MTGSRDNENYDIQDRPWNTAKSLSMWIHKILKYFKTFGIFDILKTEDSYVFSIE